MRRKFLLFTNKVLVVLTLLCYLSTLVSPEIIWVAGFFSYLIPPLFIVHGICMYLWYRWKKINMLYSAITILVGYKFIVSTIALNLDASEGHDLSVLTYNTRVFNVYDHLNKNFESSKKMINWIKQDDSDIKCFQEFYNKKDSEVFNTSEELMQNGKYYSYVQPKAVVDKQEFGLAIYSKFPIIDKGRVTFKEKSQNDAIFVDVVSKKDTIRIINVHLQSMSINANVFDEKYDWKTNLINLGKKLKKGFIARAQQLEAIEQYIVNCRYRVILCGDLNDPPYSYTYFKLQCMLNSAFEDAANGFGFSYNGKLFFLRIDNQFYGKGFKPVNHQTLRDVSYSDHFPIKVLYQIE